MSFIKSVFVFLSVIGANGIFSQGKYKQAVEPVRESKDSLILIIQSAPRFENKYYGFYPVKSKTYAVAERLWQLCSDSELVLLMNHPSDMMKAYAFKGLCERKVDVKLQRILLKQNLNNSGPLEFISGCIGGKIAYSELLRLIFSETHPNIGVFPQK